MKPLDNLLLNLIIGEGQLRDKFCRTMNFVYLETRIIQISLGEVLSWLKNG